MKNILYGLLLLSIVIPTSAEMVKYNFSGYLTELLENQNNHLGDLQPGEAFFGSFSYSTTPDMYFDEYYFQPSIVILTIGTKTLTYMDEAFIRIYNENHPTKDGDLFDFAMDGSTYQGYNLTGSRITLSDSTGTVFNDRSLPLILTYDDFDKAAIGINGRYGDYPNWEYFSFTGQVTEMTLIPEPVTLALFALGGLILRRKK